MTQDIGDNTFHNPDNCDCVRCNPGLALRREDRENKKWLLDLITNLTKERDDYQRLSQEYTVVIMELKAEHALLTAAHDQLLADMHTAEAMTKTILAQVEQILAECKAR